MDQAPVVPQRPKKKPVETTPAPESDFIPETEIKPIDPEASSKLSSPIIPSRPKKAVNEIQFTQNKNELETVNSEAFSSFKEPEESEASSPVTPNAIISGYESEAEDSTLGFSKEGSDTNNASIVETKTHELGDAAELERESEDSDAATVSPKSEIQTVQESPKTAQRVDILDPAGTTENAPKSPSAIESSANEMSRNNPPVIPARPRPSKAPNTEVESPAQDSAKNPESIPNVEEKQGRDAENLNLLNSDADSQQRHKIDSEDLKNTKQPSPVSKEAEVLESSPHAPEQQGDATKSSQSFEASSRTQPTIPSRPKKKESITEKHSINNIDPNHSSCDTKSSAEVSNVVQEPVDDASSPPVKKAPPPKPKKLSSKIAAFQQMFNQEPVSKPALAKRPSEERGKLSSDRTDFAASLSSMMGRGVALPGMANPEMMKNFSSSENVDDIDENEQSGDTPASIVPPRRARGPRGKKLPKSIQDSKVEVKSRFTIHSADLWTVDFKAQQTVDTDEVSHTAPEVDQKTQISSEEEPTTEITASEEVTVNIDDEEAEIREDTTVGDSSSQSTSQESMLNRPSEEFEKDVLENKSSDAMGSQEASDLIKPEEATKTFVIPIPSDSQKTEEKSQDELPTDSAEPVPAEIDANNELVDETVSAHKEEALEKPSSTIA